MNPRAARTLFGAAVLTLSSTLALPAFADTTTTLAPVVAVASATHVDAGEFGGRGQRMLRIAGDPALASIRQMRVIERIYLRQNQPKEAERMYRDVLGRTQNTMIRNVVNARLARLAAWQPRDLDAALVELKRGLDENLAKVP